MPEYKQECDYVEGTLDVLRISGRRQVSELAPSESSVEGTEQLQAEKTARQEKEKEKQQGAKHTAGKGDSSRTEKSAAGKGGGETLETRMKNVWESFILTLQHAAEFITTNLPQVFSYSIHFLSPFRVRNSSISYIISLFQ